MLLLYTKAEVNPFAMCYECEWLLVVSKWHETNDVIDGNAFPAMFLLVVLCFQHLHW